MTALDIHYCTIDATATKTLIHLLVGFFLSFFFFLEMVNASDIQFITEVAN